MAKDLQVSEQILSQERHQNKPTSTKGKGEKPVVGDRNYIRRKGGPQARPHKWGRTSTFTKQEHQIMKRSL